MAFDFTTLIDRRHTQGVGQSQKWQRYAEDVLPLWIADMDFVSPPDVIEALHKRVQHGVFGYDQVTESLKETLCQWSRAQYGWEIRADDQYWLPGVVPALHLASLALTEPGDGILTLTPIYSPFLKVAEHTGRLPQQAAMTAPDPATGSEWQLDLDALEASITSRTRLLLWCHPHNPTGKVWNQQTLAGLADLIERHDLLVVSDELHCDLLLDEGARHTPLAAACPSLEPRIITLWAASKTFNLAGLTTACAVIKAPALRARFKRGCRGLLPDGNALGVVASEAAYRHGEPWRQALLGVLRGHRDTLASRIAGWPGVEWQAPDATYLAWVDMRGAGLGNYPQKALLEDARVALSDGADFGQPGFVRLNFGTTATRLEEALTRIEGVLPGSR